MRDIVAAAQDNHERERRRRRQTGDDASPTVAAELRPWMEQAAKLNVGNRVLFTTRSGGAQRVTVAWKGEEGGPVAFVDPQGNNAGALPLEQVANQFKAGTARVADASDLSAVDRGWFSMLGEVHQDLAYQATHDSLTGLPNHKTFEASVQQALANAKREGREHAICLLELDQLEEIGRVSASAADNLIVKLSGVLQKHAAQRGMVARLSGGGFGVLLEGAGLDDGRQFAERQRYAIESSRCVWKGQSFSLSVSVGLAPLSADSESATEFIEAAAAACERAREAGGNCIEVHAPAETRAPQPRDPEHGEGSVAEVLAGGRLVLMRQRIAPIAADGDVKSYYEILLSVRDRAGKLIGPAEFLEVAERDDQMPEVDRWVVTNALQWLADNRSGLVGVGGYGINLSGTTLSDPSFVDYVVQ